MIMNMNGSEKTKASPYKTIWKLSQNKLQTTYEKMKAGDLRRSVRRTFFDQKRQRELLVNCPGWMIGVIYDDLTLFQKATQQELYLNSCHRNGMFIYRDQSTKEVQNWMEWRSDYDIVWYCISQNQHVTKEVLLKRLEEYTNGTIKKSVLKEELNLVNCYLVGNELELKKDHRKQKEKAEIVLKHAPGVAEKLTEELWHYCSLGGEFDTILISYDASMTLLFLFVKLLEKEHVFEWYCSFLCCVVYLHFDNTDIWFADNKDMIQSFQNLIGRLWKVREKVGTRFLELLLSRWEGFQRLRDNGHTIDSELLFSEISRPTEEKNIVIPDEIWKAANSLFQNMIISFCREHPESISEMVQRKKFFPTLNSLRFLSREVCHGPVPVTPGYLEIRTFGFYASFWDVFYDHRKDEEDTAIFRWIVVKKKGKHLAKLEMKFLQYAPEDVLLEAGKAGMFSQNCMQQYIDFCRRFGRIEIVPILIRIREQRKEERHAGTKRQEDKRDGS